MSDFPFLSDEEQQRRAKALLADPMLILALWEIEQDAIDTWRKSDSPAQREEQWHRLFAISKLDEKLKRRLDDGKMAERSAARTRRVQAGY